MSDRLVLFPHDDGVSTTVWDMDKDRYAGRLVGHTFPVGHADILGDTAVTIGGGGYRELGRSTNVVKIWNMGTFQCTANLTLPGNGLSDMSSSLLKDRLLLGTEEGSIQVWDIGGSSPVPLMELKGHGDKILSTYTSMDTRDKVMSGCIDGTVRLWDLRIGRCARVMREGHDGIGAASVSMDSGGCVAISGSWDQTVKTWDLGSGKRIHAYKCGRPPPPGSSMAEAASAEVDSRLSNVMMSASGSTFLALGATLWFKAWDLSTDPCDQQPILDADLCSRCAPRSPVCGAISRDLSKVAVCYYSRAGNGLSIRVWK